MIFCLFGVVRGVASIVGPFISTGLYEEKLADDERCVSLFLSHFPLALSLSLSRPGVVPRADALPPFALAAPPGAASASAASSSLSASWRACQGSAGRPCGGLAGARPLSRMLRRDET